MDKNFIKEKIFWQKYTDEELSEEDIFEINYNLQNFAKALLDIHHQLENERRCND